jgi:heme/copper-type cytochrome/quinol oxidase subunit 2
LFSGKWKVGQSWKTKYESTKDLSSEHFLAAITIVVVVVVVVVVIIISLLT